MRSSLLVAFALLTPLSHGHTTFGAGNHDPQLMVRDHNALIARNESLESRFEKRAPLAGDGKKRKRTRSGKCRRKTSTSSSPSATSKESTTTSVKASTTTTTTTTTTKPRSTATAAKSSTTVAAQKDVVSLNTNGSITIGGTSSSSAFTLSSSSKGSTFFNNWDFFTQSDPTNGQVTFLSEADAWTNNLISITDSGTATVRADDTTWLSAGQNRNSIRITSQATFGVGSLVVLDAVKLPYGNGVWPAFWSVGQNWPYGGEIDIVEQINNSPNNQYTLHTGSGCTMAQPMSGSGTVLVEDCDALIDGNVGCGILEKSTVSFGEAFNKNGGGVYATLFTTDGISIWFFPRDKIPANLASGDPNPDSTWGTASAVWGSSTCDMNTFFSAQTLVFDITICGVWAGNQGVWSSAGFSGTCSDAVQDPTNFVGAEFEINSVAIYNQN